MTVIEFVPGAVGVQVNCPLRGWMEAAGGEPAPRLNVSVCAGTFVSLAVAVKLTVWPRRTSRSLIGLRVGGALGRTLPARGVGVDMANIAAAPLGKRPSLTLAVWGPKVTASICVPSAAN